MAPPHTIGTIITTLCNRHSAHALDLAVAWHFADRLVASYAQQCAVSMDRIIETRRECVMTRACSLGLVESDVLSALLDLRASAVRTHVLDNPAD